tara:strand:- start:3375 stop:4121 length:747 start_codon:yes stop_codon:yes gene_type:complete
MPFWTRKPSKRAKATVVSVSSRVKLCAFDSLTAQQPDHNRLNSPFLRLPGELRNLIYSYAIFPRLDAVTITHETKPEHFGKTVLSLPLFRVSHQIRAEALSYLVANKGLKICGYEAATAFFDCIGSAIKDVRAVVIAQPFVFGQSVQVELVDLFFYFLDQAEGLQYFRSEHGLVGHPVGDDLIGADAILDLNREFVLGREELVYHFGIGVYDPKSPAFGSITGETGRMEDLWWEGGDERPVEGVMYLY